MKGDRKAIRNRLKEAGLSDPLIDAAWPAWWNDDAFASQSAKAELRFAIARKLGLSPESFFHDDVEFLWKDDARFKHLSNETEDEKSILTSFGISVCRILLQSIMSESAPDQDQSSGIADFDSPTQAIHRFASPSSRLLGNWCTRYSSPCFPT